jgi:hypothetical protein
VEFLDWAYENFDRVFGKWGRKEWTSEDYVNNIHLTTTELYELFKQTKV